MQLMDTRRKKNLAEMKKELSTGSFQELLEESRYRWQKIELMLEVNDKITKTRDGGLKAELLSQQMLLLAHCIVADKHKQITNGDY